MPQVVDLSLCSTTAGKVTSADDPPSPPPPIIDYAPEAFYLSKNTEIDTWLNDHAFIERKDSGKSSNNNPHSTLSLPPNPSLSNSSSQRYAVNLKSKPSIIGLPKTQKQTYDRKPGSKASKPGSVRLFPKKGSKPAGQPAEPGSPKVSCMGRVRSRKDRSGSGKRKKKGGGERVKSSGGGFWENFRILTIFKNHKEKGVSDIIEGRGDVENGREKKKEKGKKRKEELKRKGGGERVELTGGLGAVKRFASGRRSDAWAEEVIDMARSQPLDVCASQDKGPIWRRRDHQMGMGRGPLGDVDVEQRDWLSNVGPASV